ncbi:MAG: hypothetical protein AAGC60_19370 [Acidobacteriota bacterium]
MDDTPHRDGLRDLVSHSLTAGLCALIPVPFADDWARDLVRRRMARQVLAERGLGADAAALDLLALGKEPPTARSVARGCVQTVIVWPFRFLYKLLIKKLLRKLIFLLAVKDAVDTFSRTFHEGYLLRHAARLGSLDRTTSDDASAQRLSLASARPVRSAMDAVIDSVDPRPVESTARLVLRSSRGVLRGAVRSLHRGLRALGRSGRRDEERVLREIERDVEATGGMVDRLVAGLASNAGYLDALRRMLASRLAGTPPAVQQSAPAADATEA